LITLYHRPNTRSTRFIFLLEELGAPYEVRLVTTRLRDGGGAPDPANPHPLGKVPAISDDGVVVFESAAIAIYLTDKFPQNRIGPLAGDPERGAYLSWLAWYAGVFEPAFVSKFMSWEVPRGTAGWAPVEEVMAVIIARLTQAPYFTGERFSAADVLYATSFALFANSPVLPKSAVIEDYVKRVLTRPAFARAMAKQNG
jgi:glutathione S-transferase